MLFGGMTVKKKIRRKKRRLRKIKSFFDYLTVLSCLGLTSCLVWKMIENEQLKEASLEKLEATSTDQYNQLLDEFIVSFDEENIELSEEACSLLEEISSLEIENDYINNLEYEKYLPKFLILESIDIKHSNTSLYDEENDDIYWDKLSKYIWFNSHFNLKMIQFANEMLVPVIDTKSLNYSEIESVVESFRKYIETCRMNGEHVDMKKLACQLQDEVFMFVNVDNDVKAATSKNGIIWNLFLGDRSNILDSSTSIHEFYHLKRFCCLDVSDYLPQMIGLHGESPLISSKTWEDVSLNFGSFLLEEAAAEEEASKYCDTEYSSYYFNETVKNLCELVFILSDNQDVGDYKYSSGNQHVLTLLSRFPYLSSDDLENEVLAVQKMLAGFDCLFEESYRTVSPSPFEEGLNKTALDFSTYSKKALDYYFLTQLILWNERHPEVTLEDNFSFIVSYESASIYYHMYAPLENGEVHSIDFWGILVEYLMKRYGEASINYAYLSFIENKQLSFPDYFPDSKREFCSMITGFSYNDQSNQLIKK